MHVREYLERVVRPNVVEFEQDYADLRLAHNALHSVEARLCRWILQVRDRIDGDVIALTQDFLAQMLAVRRPTVTLVAQKLQNAGLIRYRRGRIVITDREGLEKLACECAGEIRNRPTA